MKADQPLLTSRTVHRALALRLALAVVLLSFLISVLAYLTLRERFLELIDAVAITGTVRVNAHLLPLLDRPGPLDPVAVQEELGRMSGGRVAHLAQGRFIIIRLFDLEGRQIASLQDAADPQMAAINAGMASRPTPVPGSRPELFRVGTDRLVLVSQALTDSTGREVLTGVAVFAVAPETLVAHRWHLVRTVLITLGLILAVALVLYPLIRSLLDRVFGLSHSLLMANLDSIRALGSAIAKRDSDTDEHNYRVTLYCVALSEAMALPKMAITGLIKGAFLHDVGKIGVHDRILLKPGRLDSEEFEEMKKHVEYGVDIVKSCRWLDDAAEVVAGHHEKFDGSGYPAGLRGEEIPLGARIFAVTDVFDALGSRRPYKEPMPLDSCLATLAEGRGGHFDPAVVDAFCGLAPKIYAHYGNCPPEQLKKMLADVVARYFEPATVSAR